MKGDLRVEDNGYKKGVRTDDEAATAGEEEVFGIPISEVTMGTCGQTITIWDACATKSFMSEEWASAHKMVIRESGKWSSVRTVAGPSLQRERWVDTTVTLTGQGKSRMFSCTFQLLKGWSHQAKAILGKPFLNMAARTAGLQMRLDRNLISLESTKGERFSFTANGGPPLAVEARQLSGDEAIMAMLTEAGELGEGEDEFPEAADLRREFSDVFTGEFDGPKIPLPVEGVVEFKNGLAPPLNRPWKYDFSEEERRFLKVKLQDMEEKGYIELCDDPALLSTMFLVEKPDSIPEQRAFRVVHDLRICNEATQPRSFPQERAGDLLHRMAGHRYMTVLDISDAFFQVSVCARDRKYLAFVTPWGTTYAFKSLPMGFVNSPYFWQTALARILERVRENLVVYMDDIGIFSDNLEEHIQKVREVMGILRRHHLKVSGKKVQLIKTRGVRFLGHVLGEGSVAPMVDKRVITAWQSPTTKGEAKSWLGLFNYYREFIPRASEITKPMDEVCGAKTKFRWGLDQEAAFQASRAAVLNCNGLQAFSYDPAVPMRLLSDASATAVGGALEQQRGDGKWATVALFSKRFSPTRQVRSAIHREAYGILCNLRHFKRLLKHREFTLFTDCKPLLAALRGQEPTDARWQQLIAEILSFRVKLAFIAGKENTLADACSRHEWAPGVIEDIFDSKGEEVLATETAAFEISDEEWSREYEKDGRCKLIWATLTGKRRATAHAYLAEKYRLEGALVFLRARGQEERDRLLVPEGLVERFFHQYHDGAWFGGHGGVTVTYLAMRAQFYWPGMFAVIRRYVRACRACSRAKPWNNTTTEAHPLPVPTRLFQGQSVDFLTGFPPVKFARGGVLVECDAILTVTCLLSRMVALVPVSEAITGEESVQVLLEEVFIGQNWGLPEYLVSDADPRFRSKAYTDAFAALKVSLNMSTTKHPETDGASEVKNRQILDVLRAYCVAEPTRWAAQLKYVAWTMNNATSRTTGLAPLEVVYGQVPRMNWPTGPAAPGRSLPARLDEVCVRREVALGVAYDNLTAARDEYVLREEPARPPQNLQVGDMVYVNTEVLVPVEFRNAKHKLVPRFCGPFAILAKMGAGAYRLDLPVTSRAKKTVNAQYLKKHVASGMVHPTQRDIPLTALAPGQFETEAIVAHFGAGVGLTFQVKWFGFEDMTVEPLCCFTDKKGRVINELVKEYVAKNAVTLP